MTDSRLLAMKRSADIVFEFILGESLIHLIGGPEQKNIRYIKLTMAVMLNNRGRPGFSKAKFRWMSVGSVVLLQLYLHVFLCTWHVLVWHILCNVQPGVDHYVILKLGLSCFSFLGERVLVILVI